MISKRLAMVGVGVTVVLWLASVAVGCAAGTVATTDEDAATGDAATGDAATGRDGASGDAATGRDAASGCTGGKTSCGGVCVTLASDNSNCGRCGNTCPIGQTCANG